jgi:hypothetical protein
MRIVSECRCSKHHRNTTYFARCAWPGSVVSGQGQLAIVISCPEPQVVLVERLRWAHILRTEFAVFGCSAACPQRHELVAIDIDGLREGA